MRKLSFSKQKISIQLIGRFRFWAGIIGGIITAITLSLAFNYTRETFRFFTGMSNDLIILEDGKLEFYNFVFSALSAVLGLSITIWIWMANNLHHRKKSRIYKQLGRTNALLVFWFVLLAISRFGYVVSIVLHTSRGYEGNWDPFDPHWLLFVLLPIVIFLQNWFSVRMEYRAGKWILFSLLGCILFTFSLNWTTTVDQQKLNGLYFKQFEKDYAYIDNQLEEARSKYRITYDDKTITDLKKWYSDGSITQVQQLKVAFSKPDPVSLDSILLQKIVIRNYKFGGWSNYRRESFDRWHFALPKDVLKQIYLHDPQSSEAVELFEILKEQIDLVNSPRINHVTWNQHTKTEKRRSFAARVSIPTGIREQLKDIRQELVTNEKYAEHSQNLPEIIIREDEW